MPPHSRPKRSRDNGSTEGFHWRAARLILPWLAEHRGRIALAMACLVLAKAGGIGAPFLLKRAVDALNPGTAAGAAVVSVFALVAAYGFARFLNVLLAEVRDTVFGRVTERAMHRIGLRVFEHLHALDLEFHLERRTGGLARDIERGTDGIGFLMRFFVFNIAPTLFEILVVAGLLAWHYGLAYAAITVCSVLVYGTFSVLTTDWRTAFVREANKADSATHTRAIDSLLNYETVKYFGNERFEAARYDVALEDWERARRRNRLSLFALNAGQAAIVAAAMSGAMALAARDVFAGSMSIGDFVLINAFMMQLFMPLNFLGMVYREIKGSLASIEEMFALLAIEPRIADLPGARALAAGPGRVEFRDVSFRYRSDRDILREVSFAIEPGTKLAVVGASGAGKSTLVKLLFRFYDAGAGSIAIDGQEIRGMKLDSLRRAIAIVPQDTVLFNDTLLENVRYGRPGATDAEVAAALELAQLAGFVARLPEGWHTRVGERGMKLSGGERQRVAIARAILKRAPILVFDEATSSLDSHSEASILDALRALARGHTSLVIAHRLSTIVDADRIVVLDEGRVVEQGTHEDLLAAGGAYAALWARQHRDGDGGNNANPVAADAPQAVC
jgi:ATP-binding cassette subfamily B protein